jgi:ABC-type bacteriocin/lantibiotic exporter with double-glycine peptidase domain
MMIAAELAFILGVIALLFYVNPIGTGVIIVFFGSAAFTFHLITKKRLLGWGIERQTSDENSGKQLLQAFGGIKDVILLNKRDFFLKNFNYHNGNKAIIVAKQNTLQLD